MGCLADLPWAGQEPARTEQAYSTSLAVGSHGRTTTGRSMMLSRTNNRLGCSPPLWTRLVLVPLIFLPERRMGSATTLEDTGHLQAFASSACRLHRLGSGAKATAGTTPVLHEHSLGETRPAAASTSICECIHLFASVSIYLLVYLFFALHTPLRIGGYALVCSATT